VCRHSVSFTPLETLLLTQIADWCRFRLAICELHIVTAAITLRVAPQMKLYDTTVADIRYDHEYFTPQMKAGTKGVRVLIE
jgi:hypothetical protein